MKLEISGEPNGIYLNLPGNGHEINITTEVLIEVARYLEMNPYAAEARFEFEIEDDHLLDGILSWRVIEEDYL